MGLITAVKNSLHGDANASAGNEPVDSTRSASATHASSGAAESYATQHAPVVKETVHDHRREEITPVIDREREETNVTQVVQPITDNRQEVHHASTVNAPLERETVEQVNAQDARRYQDNRAAHKSYTHTESAGAETVMNAPNIQESVRRHDVVEVQPVIEREVRQDNVLHVEQPIHERVVAAPTVHETVQNAPMSMSEFEARGGSFKGGDLHRV